MTLDRILECVAVCVHLCVHVGVRTCVHACVCVCAHAFCVHFYVYACHTEFRQTLGLYYGRRVTDP